MLATVLALAASFSLHAASPRCVGRPLPPLFLTAGLRSLRTRNDAPPCRSRTIRGLHQPLLSASCSCLHPTKLTISRSDKPASGGPLEEPRRATSAAAATRLLRSSTIDTRLLRAVQIVSTAEVFQRTGGKAARRRDALGNFSTKEALANVAAHRSVRVLAESSATAGHLPDIRMDGQTTDPESTTTKRPLIGTHSGSFHADEVLATVMLLSLPEYKDAKLLRSRDPAALARCNIVVDVGSEYSPAALRFDHHQRSFVTTFYDEDASEDTAGARERGGRERGEEAVPGGQKCDERGGVLPQPNGDRNGFASDKKRKNELVTREKGRDTAAASMGEQGEGPPPKRKPVIKLSSAGLIYKHFGKRLLAHRYGWSAYPYANALNAGLPSWLKQVHMHAFGYTSKCITDADTLNTVYQRLYRTFVEAIDAIDNGVSIVPGGGPVAYKDSTNLSSRIAQCNPPWNAELLRKRFPDYPRYHPEKQPLYPVEIEGGEVEENIGFRRAMLLAAEALDGAARGMIDVWLPARDIVATAVKDRYNVHPSGQMVKLERWCPFEEHLFLLEKEMNVEPPPFFCLYPEVKDGKEVGWRIRAVGVEGHMLESRLPLSSRFRGLRGSELGNAVCNAIEESLGKQNIKPEDFVHCHATGFIAGATTLVRHMFRAAHSVDAVCIYTSNCMTGSFHRYLYVRRVFEGIL